MKTQKTTQSTIPDYFKKKLDGDNHEQAIKPQETITYKKRKHENIVNQPYQHKQSKVAKFISNNSYTASHYDTEPLLNNTESTTDTNISIGLNNHGYHSKKFELILNKKNPYYIPQLINYIDNFEKTSLLYFCKSIKKSLSLRFSSFINELCERPTPEDNYLMRYLKLKLDSNKFGEQKRGAHDILSTQRVTFINYLYQWKLKDNKSYFEYILPKMHEKGLNGLKEFIMNIISSGHLKCLLELKVPDNNLNYLQYYLKNINQNESKEFVKRIIVKCFDKKTLYEILSWKIPKDFINKSLEPGHESNYLTWYLRFSKENNTLEESILSLLKSSSPKIIDYLSTNPSKENPYLKMFVLGDYHKYFEKFIPLLLNTQNKIINEIMATKPITGPSIRCDELFLNSILKKDLSQKIIFSSKILNSRNIPLLKKMLQWPSIKDGYFEKMLQQLDPEAYFKFLRTAIHSQRNAVHLKLIEWQVKEMSHFYHYWSHHQSKGKEQLQQELQQCQCTLAVLDHFKQWIKETKPFTPEANREKATLSPASPSLLTTRKRSTKSATTARKRRRLQASLPAPISPPEAHNQANTCLMEDTSNAASTPVMAAVPIAIAPPSPCLTVSLSSSPYLTKTSASSLSSSPFLLAQQKPATTPETLVSPVAASSASWPNGGSVSLSVISSPALHYQASIWWTEGAQSTALPPLMAPVPSAIPSTSVSPNPYWTVSLSSSPYLTRAKATSLNSSPAIPTGPKPLTAPPALTLPHAVSSAITFNTRSMSLRNTEITLSVTPSLKTMLEIRRQTQR